MTFLLFFSGFLSGFCDWSVFYLSFLWISTSSSKNSCIVAFCLCIWCWSIVFCLLLFARSIIILSFFVVATAVLSVIFNRFRQKYWKVNDRRFSVLLPYSLDLLFWVLSVAFTRHFDAISWFFYWVILLRSAGGKFDLQMKLKLM